MLTKTDIFSDQDAYEVLNDIDQPLMQDIELLHKAGRPRKEILAFIDKSGGTALILSLVNQALYYLDEQASRDTASRQSVKEQCLTNQRGLCVVCGRGLYNSGDLHEAIIKRSDLPNDNRIMVVHNCVVLHSSGPCHENTKEVDDTCISWLCSAFDVLDIADWIISLNMVQLPGRALDVLRLADLARTESQS